VRKKYYYFTENVRLISSSEQAANPHPKALSIDFTTEQETPATEKAQRNIMITLITT